MSNNTEFHWFGFEVAVIRKKIRAMYLRMCASTGQLRVSAPPFVPVETIKAFIHTRLGWIQRQQHTVTRKIQPACADGESHYVFGKSYVLRLIESQGRPVVRLTETELILQVPDSTDVEHKKKTLHTGLARLLQDVLAPCVSRWEEAMGVSVSKCSIRLMTSRWGSCTPKQRTIRINLELVKKPPECLEYVVVHELAHLLEPSHNWRFKAIMDRFLPDWRARRELLKHFPG